MKIKKTDYLPLDHSKIKTEFEGSPTFINYFSVMGINSPVAVYRSENPNRKKGHKRYMFLFRRYDPVTDKMGWTVSGSEKIDDRDRYRAAVYCSKCDELVYSAYRHDMNKCSCGEKFIDGGEAYFRTNGPLKTIDLLTDKVVERIEEDDCC